MKYRIYEVDLSDRCVLQCVVENEDRAKQIRNLLYTIQEKCMADGSQTERMRYVIICDM
jgi:hypothetical protein